MARRNARNHVGTSGWQYKEWSDDFFAGVKKKEWLEHYATQFDTVELNGSFYRTPTPEQMKKKHERLPEGFVMAVKVQRGITHYNRLRNCRPQLSDMIHAAEGLNENLGPLLYQLPYNFQKDMERLKTFLSWLPQEHRHTIEFRHESWWDEEVYDALREKNVAFCMFEIGDNRSPKVATADFTYLRLHGRGKSKYTGYYTRSMLRRWKEWLVEQGGDAYVYFDNTGEGMGCIENARTMQHMMSAEP